MTSVHPTVTSQPEAQQAGTAMVMNPMLAGITLPPPPKWAPAGGRSGGPPGLEALADQEVLKIVEDINIGDLTSPVSLPNRYSVRNANDEQIYLISEALSPMIGNPFRQIDLTCVDSSNKACMTLRRLQRVFDNCGTCCPMCVLCCPCCYADTYSRMEVRSGDGKLVGVTRHLYDACDDKFVLENAASEESFESVADCCSNYGRLNRTFRVHYRDSKDTTIQRLFTGVRTQFFGADYFQIHFPKDMDVVSKSLVLATTILIDYVYYETRRRGRYNRRRRFNRY